MKAFYFIVTARLIALLACIAGAVYLAGQSKDGWGWLIFLAVIIASSKTTLSED